MLRLFSYLENSTSTTLLCDAVTKELEGRHSFANGWWETDEHNHWGNCSVCGEISKQNHTFTAEGYCSVCWQTSYTYTDGINYKNTKLLNGHGCMAEHVVIRRRTDFLEVNSIDHQAFALNNNIKSVAIPETVTDIQHLVFCGCQNLTKVIITNNKIKIFDSAFECDLKEIIFRGTQAEWAEVAKGNENGLWLVENVRIVCTDGVIVTGHQLDSKWSYDETNHYHACTCGEKADVTPHSFTEHFDDTGSWMQCECGAKNTETFTAHTHSTNWSYNDIAHYHKCDSCEHRVDAELHQYYNDCYPFCLICGYERKVPPHSYSGECDNTCNICGHVRSIIKEHTYSSECDEECNECSAKRTVEAEHSYTNDCDSDCELCGKTREATHTICYDWKTDYYYHWQECACGENISERSYHNFDSDGHCTVCGDKDKTSKGLEFNEYTIGDGQYATEKYELKSMGTCTDTVVIIPRTYNNIPVTRIAAYTFKNQNNVTKIILPDTIEILKSYAFSYCGITELTIPASVNHNNEFAILNCPNLETVTFEEGFRNLSRKHFLECPMLKTVNLPSTLGRIETKQFNHPNVTIKYNGTMDKWNSISKDSNWAYDFYGKYMCPTVVCTDGTIKNHVYDVEGNFYNEYQHWTKQCSCGQPDYSTGDYHTNANSTDCPATGCDGCDYTGTFHNKVNLKIENEYYSHPDDYHYLYSFCDYCKQLVYLNKSSHKMVNEKDATHHWQCCTGCNYKINKEAHHGGTATCTEQAKCEDCGTAYGELLPHHGGKASCTEQAKCEDCGTPYGELHHYSAWWSSNSNTHWHACGVCNAVKKDEAEHTPGTAFDNDNDSHWNKCTVCDAKVNVENHTYVNHRCSDCGKDEFTSSGPIVVPGIGGGGHVILNPTLNCGHKQYDSGDHTTCAGCGNYRCDGNNHGLCEHCGEYICKKGHTQINYNWASDNSKCTANRVCSKSGKVVETETTIDIEKTVTQERSCTADEIADLTASFVHPIFEKQTQKSVKTAEKADHSLVWKNNETKHWSACKNCDFTELEEDHSFTDDSDIDCNFCGYKRAVAQAFTVKIDGVAQTVSGAEFTLPDSSEKGFIAYYDGANYYDAGSKIAVDKNFEFSTIAIGEVKMLNGASIRLSEKSGIRFETQVDTTKLSALPSTAKVEKGTLITLKELATSDLTLESDYKTVDVKYLADEYRENGTFAGSIVNIQDKNLSKAFVGRGYVTVTVGDITKTIYADYYDNDINNNTRLVGYVAYHYRFNCAEQFDALTESQKELIDKWIGSYIR